MLFPLAARSQKKELQDDFASLINVIRDRVVRLDAKKDIAVPSDEDFKQWGKAYNYFRTQSLDSCRSILASYNYTLIQVKDNKTGVIYDFITERFPVQKGWGTFIYNRNHAKRLFIHVNHPVDDENVLTLGVEFFRRMKAEWLLIAGTAKYVENNKIVYDPVGMRRSIFQRWHEMVTDLTHVTLSLHGFNGRSYSFPIGETDIVLSNGKTTDNQWGISQISLSLRDSLRANGYASSLAMYDSGYAALAGAKNVQAIFSNDSVGFGHWINVEMSSSLRASVTEYSKLVAVIDRALELTGRKISHQMNRAFGLVSPRIVRLDASRRILFPPINGGSYQIISYNSNREKNDTAGFRLGKWVNFSNSHSNVSHRASVDTSRAGLSDEMRIFDTDSVTQITAFIGQSSGNLTSPIIHVGKRSSADTVGVNNVDDVQEPLQVHRIPLQSCIVTLSSSDLSGSVVGYKWNGVIRDPITVGVALFRIGSDLTEGEENLPDFLIPIIAHSFHHGKSSYVGIRMTKMLISEIARLVSDSDLSEQDISLMAEQTDGKYFLRLFPAYSK